jgi:hypothetical protein
VTITAAATGEVLRYNGSAWVDAVLTEADISDLGTYSATGHTHVAADVTDFSAAADARIAAASINASSDVRVLSPVTGHILEYNAGALRWDNVVNAPLYTNLDLTGATLADTPGIADDTVTMGTSNSILVGNGTNYVPGYAADEHASMTFQGDPADGDYYMILAMPCAAVIQSITAKTVGTGATINYQVKKGTLGGTETVVHAVTGATTTKADVATITSSALAIDDELWVALDTSVSMGQFSITVNYRPTHRFVV